MSYILVGLAYDNDKMAAYRECVAKISSRFTCIGRLHLESRTGTLIFVAAFHQVYADIRWLDTFSKRRNYFVRFTEKG